MKNVGIFSSCPIALEIWKILCFWNLLEPHYDHKLIKVNIVISFLKKNSFSALLIVIIFF
jgi:hypothetical protein